MRIPREAAYPFLLFFAVGCASAHDAQSLPPTQHEAGVTDPHDAAGVTDPQDAASVTDPITQEAGVTSPLSHLQVSVALASAHLGVEGCTHDESGAIKTMSCARPIDASPPQGTGLCGGPCDFSSVQLSFASGSSGSAAHIQVTTVALLDAATGADLAALSAYTPLLWNGTQYTPWDETIAPSAQLKVSYTLSPPAWSKLDPSFTYSHEYRVRITIVVDGVAVAVESPPLTRPAPVQT